MSDIFRFNETDYNPFTLEQLPSKDVRAEYSRLRSIARKRIGRLEKANLQGFSAAYHGEFPTLRGLTDEEARLELVRAYRFLSSKTSTVKGARAYKSKVVESLQLHFPGINEDNLSDFGRIMDLFRASGFDSVKDWSGRIARAFSESHRGRKRGGTARKLLQWAEGLGAEQLSNRDLAKLQKIVGNE